MRKAEIHIRQWFPVAPEALFEHFLRPERLGEIWPGAFRRVRRSPGADPDGAGAVREIRLSGLRFREQITRCESPELIEYRLVGRLAGMGLLLRHHRGLIRFEPEGAGTVLDYRIEFETWLPGIAGLGLALEKPLRDGINRLARRLETP